MRRFAPLLLCLMAAGQPASPGQVDWRWSREGVGCSLEQTYSTDGKIITLSRTPGNDITSISIGDAGDILAPSKSYPDGKILFSAGDEASVDIYVTSEGNRRQIVTSSDDSEILAKLARAPEFEFVQEKLGKAKVPVRSAAAAVQALRTCEDSRMREWGIDPVAWRALKARPLPKEPSNNWLSPDDYPIGAIYDGRQGYLISRLDVGPDGVPTGCTSLNRNRPAHYRDKMCLKLMHRARFKPALDVTGKPVAAPYVVVVRFRLA